MTRVIELRGSRLRGNDEGYSENNVFNRENDALSPANDAFSPANDAFSPANDLFI
jgi:hypothetical protein